MGLKSVSIFTKIALVTSGFAILFHLIGYGSDSWHKAERFGVTVAEEGLWKSCNYAARAVSPCINIDAGGSTATKDQFRTVRAFTTLALLMMIAVTVSLVLALFLSLFRMKLLVLLEMGVAIASGVLIIIAVIIYGSGVIPNTPNVHASWSLALCVIGALLSIATGVLIVLGAFFNKSSE